MSNEHFVARLQKILHDAAQYAVEANHRYVTLETLLAVILRDDGVKDIITSVGGDYDNLVAEVEEYLQTEGSVPKALVMPGVDQSIPPRETSTVASVLQMTVARAKAAGKKEVLPQDLLVNIMEAENSYASHYISKNGIEPLSVKEYISHGMGSADDDEDTNGDDDVVMTPFGPMHSRQKTGPMTEKKAKKILEEYLTNLNEEAEKGRIDPLIGRESEVNQVVTILAQRRKNNPVLRGEAGVGKTAVPEGLARIINEATKAQSEGTVEQDFPDFPKFLIGATIWGLEIGTLVAGTKYRGEFEEKLKSIISAVHFLNTETAESHILFIDEIHTALGAGATSGGSLDAGNILKPALTKGTLRTIGSTTFDEYQKYFEKDRALARRFKPVDIYEPSEEDCFRILQGLRPYYEKHHNIEYTDDALKAAIRLTTRYMFNAHLPDKAIDVIDAAGATQQVLADDKKVKVITEKEIEVEVAKIARITPDSASKDDIEKLHNLSDQLKEVVFGQDAAIATLEDAVYLSRAGLRAHNKTKGSYLFGGPTGVGKTEVCKQLAKILDIELVRFNMSEYMEKHTVSRLIGAPPGYVGFDSQGGSGAGLLTSAVDKQPHCVLLMDEVDKAHPDVFNILLQVMDDGKLTNSTGKTVDFSHVILIMTTNAGAQDSAKPTIGIARDIDGFDMTKQLEAIEKFFAPEFRNRLDGIVIFDRLSPETMLYVVDKFIKELNLLSAEKNVRFELEPCARAWLAREGYDPLYGARPLARVIQNHISKPISREILFGKLKNGGTAKISLSKETQKMETRAGEVEKTVEKIKVDCIPVEETA